jgi:polyferredoxin
MSDSGSKMITAVGRLRLIKAAHTLAWAFFAACIVGIPLLAWARRFDLALLFIGIVAVEVGIIVVNGWRCPLTAVAARYTEDRRPNFDIYLPEWLARYNKEIFGPLFGAGVLLTLFLWLGR